MEKVSLMDVFQKSPLVVQKPHTTCCLRDTQNNMYNEMIDFVS
jgi:hypothetical protein